MTGNVILKQSLSAALQNAGGRKPVSYTHLDVYKRQETHASIASRRMFNMTGVKYRAYQPTGREIKLDV